MKKPWNVLVWLMFIVAVLYIAGLVWVAVKGSSCPEGVLWFYPWMPGADKISSGEAVCLQGMVLR